MVRQSQCESLWECVRVFVRVPKGVVHECAREGVRARVRCETPSECLLRVRARVCESA
jgi:hypothetical protein